MPKQTEELSIKVKADTAQAERAVGELDRDLDKLEKPREVGVKATVKNARDVDELFRKIEQLDREDADILLRNNAQAVERDIRGLIRQIDKLDADDPEVTVKAEHLASLRGDLKQINNEIDRINHKSVAPDTKATAGGLKGLVSSFKGGMSNIASSIDLPTAAIGGLSAAVGVAATAVAHFAIGAVRQFTDLGVEVGKFSDATGTTAEFASQLVEVSGDLGISADAIQGAIGKMNKTLGASPDAFKQYGVAVQTANDGTIDVAATFLNAVEAIQSIPDASTQAAAAAAIFGKSWQGAAELINTPIEELRANLEGVSEQKTFDEKEVAKARKFRDSMDQVSDAVDDVKLSVGELLVEAAPVLTGIANLIESQLAGWTELGRKIDEVLPFDLVPQGQDDFTRNMDKAVEITQRFGGSSDQLAAKLRGVGIEQQAVNELVAMYLRTHPEQRVREQLAAQADLADGLEETAAAYETAARKAQDYADKQAALVGDAQTLAEAERRAADALNQSAEARANTQAVLKDEKSTMADVADAVKSESDAAISAADAVGVYSDQLTKAADGSVDMVAHVDSMNASLLEQAKNSSPAARAEIVHYTATLNKIPASTETQILALLDEGKVDEANRVLADASKTRTSAIDAEAHTADAERKLDEAARTRTAKLKVQIEASEDVRRLISGGGGSGNYNGNFGPSGTSAPVPVAVPTSQYATAPVAAVAPTATVGVMAAPVALAAPPVYRTTLIVQAGIVTDAARLARAMMRAQRRTQRLAGTSWSER